MKKLISLFTIIALVFVCGCTNNSTKPSQDDKIQIVTTVFPFYDFVKNIVGDRAEVTMLLPTGADVHSFEPTAQDVIKIKESDLFINIGSGADPWTDVVIEDSINDGIYVVSASEFIDKEHLYYDHEASHGHNYNFDEHIWTSLSNAEDIVEGICNALMRIDEKNAQYYKKNAEAYENKIDRLDEKFETVTEYSKRNTIVFADSFPFAYLADDYDLRYISAFPGCSSESEPSAQSIAKIIDVVKKENIPIVFYTETSNQRVADMICEETGAEKFLFHSCHTVTKKQFEGGTTYLELMEENLKALKKALN